MKKLNEKIIAKDESVVTVTTYKFDDLTEKIKFKKMNDEEISDYFDVIDASRYEVFPGALYHTYDFSIKGNELMVKDTLRRNI